MASSIGLPQPGRSPEIIRKRPLLRYSIGLLVAIALPLIVFPQLVRNMMSSDFLPHIYCYLQNPKLIWIHGVSDVLIGLSYVAISFTLAYLVHSARQDIPFSWVFIAFGLFIVACGMTHFMEVWTLWQPVYWLSGNVKIITAIASVATALVLPPQVPRVLALIRAAKMSEERRRKLEIANRELESFSYSVSHDLRSPLRTIDGFSQILLEDYSGALDAQGQDYLHRVRGASQRMASLIDALLELSRVTRGEVRITQVNMSEAARQVAAELDRSAPERKVEWVIPDGISAHGDDRMLAAVLENLLSNAFKFTGKKPAARIELGMTHLDGERVYFVRDNGAGFDIAYAEKLFAPFQRLHAASEFPGSGVGLATVQRIIERHEGRIWAESQLGEGATFYFALPEGGPRHEGQTNPAH